MLGIGDDCQDGWIEGKEVGNVDGLPDEIVSLDGDLLGTQVGLMDG